jgi:aminoglycoside phosphotransferase (APT) family kinase protein
MFTDEKQMGNSNRFHGLEKLMEEFLPPNSRNISLHDIHQFEHQGAASTTYPLVITYVSDGSKQKKYFILKMFADTLEAKGLKEYLVLKTLQKFNFSAPIAYHFETKNGMLDNPFLIMEKVVGKNGSDYMNNERNSKNFVDRMAKTLAELHQIDQKFFPNSNELRAQYHTIQHRLVTVRRFIKENSKTFLGFLPRRQRKFITAVKRLEEKNLEKFCPTLIHMDYFPSHVFVSKSNLVVIDWGESSIGDPAYDVARTYHNLKIQYGRSKLDLGEHFVNIYKRYTNQKLPNLEVYKELAAIGLALWSGLSPFDTNKLLNYGRLVDITFGNLFGRFIDSRTVNNRQQIIANHPVKISHNIDYLHRYVIDYLETAV